jgi:hypothetical protein
MYSNLVGGIGFEKAPEGLSIVQKGEEIEIIVGLVTVNGSV